MAAQPDIVYHYCSADSLIKILEKGVLWLTHANSLNDTLEHRYGEEAIQGMLAQALELAKGKDREDLSGLTDEYLNKKLGEPYVTSFSMDGDVLSQWRAYADDGAGFAVGFRREAFGISNALPIQPLLNNPEGKRRSLASYSVEYEHPGSQTLAKMLLERFVTRAGSMREPGVAASLLRLSHFFCKNPAFAEEKEWRICYVPRVLDNFNPGKIRVIGALPDIKFRASRYGITSFFELPFACIPKQDRIAEVVAGPKYSDDHSVSQLGLMLKHFGYTNAKPLRSNASYR